MNNTCCCMNLTASTNNSNTNNGLTNNSSYKNYNNPNNNNNTRALTKLYYPNISEKQPQYYYQESDYKQPRNQQLLRKNNELIQQQKPIIYSAGENINRAFNSSTILQYYYNNINNNDSTRTKVVTTTSIGTGTTNAEYLAKQSNININNIFAMSGNQHQKISLEKNQFSYSSTVRPLALKKVVTTPKQVSNFFMKTFRSDSQKRPLLLNHSTIRKNEFHGGDGFAPNFTIIPDKTGLKISPIYSISQNIDKYAPRKLRQQSTYFRNVNQCGSAASCTRPLFVKPTK